MSTWKQVADLPVEIDRVELEGLEQDVSSDFTRKSTIVHLLGGGEEGLGEDVVYQADEHEAAWAAGPPDLAGSWTLASFSEHVGGLDLFGGQEPESPASRNYRIWAYESAALDLALRQAGTSLHAHLGLEPRPITYVVSLRLGDPASLEPVTRRLARYPDLRFKLDPTADWDDELCAALAATGAVDSLDLKGQYSGTIVDNPADPALYQRVVDYFPDAWIEDPKLTDETDEILRPHRDRITWDAPIHSIADVEALPFPPKTVNVKPSRFGAISALFDAYDWLAERGIGAYGGGQFELGVGRGQIQLLAALFHPDGPNDTSPTGFHAMDPPPGIEPSPMPPRAAPRGFRRES
ncbi:hypothetical protein LRS13_21960 [Svornostia abyssi]|uniref:Enolase C-terminal domain-containing protein n=1 Tax=Svornostia abyssi TaxID=2898438 RepID=A0ABY5PFR6_9ACTN|nr:hypothetical protein LRS13_21960 [Parviterribacteraceae bacterium J379]